MSKIRSKNTKPEIIVRSALHQLGYRFRIHRKDLPGKPDLVLPRYNTAIFVHGCFWHYHKECREERIPNSNFDYWKEKLEKNQENDRKNIMLCIKAGWEVIVIWECELEKKFTPLLKK